MVDKLKQNLPQFIWSIISGIAAVVGFIFITGQIYGRSSGDLEQVKKDVTEIKTDLNQIKDKKVDKEVFEILLENITEIKRDLREIRKGH